MRRLIPTVMALLFAASLATGTALAKEKAMGSMGNSMNTPAACKKAGGVWVKAYKNKAGTWVKAYCRSSKTKM